jgi:hypothetical protein
MLRPAARRGSAPRAHLDPDSNERFGASVTHGAADRDRWRALRAISVHNPLAGAVRAAITHGELEIVVLQG